MSNQAGDLPSLEPQSPFNASSKRDSQALDGDGGGMIAALPNASVTRRLVRETNAVESRVITSSSSNHVSLRHAGAACSAALSTLPATPSRVSASDCQVESPHPSITTEKAQAVSGNCPLKLKESSVKAQRKVKKTEDTVPAVGEEDEDTAREVEMCVPESPKEQLAADKASDNNKKECSPDNRKKEGSKTYEIPLTILPKASAPKSRKKQAKDSTTGRWTHEEHQAFLEGLKVFGREWKKVADKIPTRTSAQIRSHAQKYFSKLARDEVLAAHEPPAVSQQQEIQIQPPQALPHSVQRTAERILADPAGAQREVEETLRQLRERYRQLQIRLESQRRPSLDRIVEDGASENDGVPVGLLRQGGYAPGIERRKRSLEEVSAGSVQQLDDASSVSSDLSASLASLSPSREFGNEELIALHVLGGTLHRSASGTELRAQSPSPSLSEGEDSDAKKQRLDSSNDHAEGKEDPQRDQDGDEAMI